MANHASGPRDRRILEEANAVYLHGGGSINHRAGEDRDRGALALRLANSATR